MDEHTYTWRVLVCVYFTLRMRTRCLQILKSREDHLESVRGREAMDLVLCATRKMQTLSSVTHLPTQRRAN